MHAFDMAAIAEATGSVISAVLFGALAGAGVLPFPRQAFEAAIKRGGVGVEASLAAFTAGFEATTSRRRDGEDAGRDAAAADARRTGCRRDADEGAPHQPIPAELLREAATFPAAGARDRPRRDRAHRRLSGPRLRAALSRPPRADRRRPTRDGRLLAETARQLALGMAYEDTIRVAELKIRPSRFERVREEVRVNDDQILEIAEFMHPRTQEIADTLPAPLGRFILQHRLGARPGRPHDAQGPRGEDVLAARLPAALHGRGVQAAAPALAALSASRTAHLEDWLATVQRVAATHYDLAVEVAAARNLVKGYGDTHERGRARFETLMGLLPALSQRPDGAAQLAALRKAANADDTGAALDAAIAMKKLMKEAGEQRPEPVPQHPRQPRGDRRKEEDRDQHDQPEHDVGHGSPHRPAAS